MYPIIWRAAFKWKEYVPGRSKFYPLRDVLYFKLDFWDDRENTASFRNWRKLWSKVIGVSMHPKSTASTFLQRGKNIFTRKSTGQMTTCFCLFHSLHSVNLKPLPFLFVISTKLAMATYSLEKKNVKQSCPALSKTEVFLLEKLTLPLSWTRISIKLCQTHF